LAICIPVLSEGNISPARPKRSHCRSVFWNRWRALSRF